MTFHLFVVFYLLACMYDLFDLEMLEKFVLFDSF